MTSQLFDFIDQISAQTWDPIAIFEPEENILIALRGILWNPNNWVNDSPFELEL